MDPLIGSDAAVKRIGARQDDIDALVAQTREMSARLRALRVTTTDPRSLVMVTINSQGAVLDVRFGPKLRQYEPDFVSRTVMATIHDARRRAIHLTSTIIMDMVGPDSVAVREMVLRAADRDEDRR